MVRSIFPPDSGDGRYCPDCDAFKPFSEFYTAKLDSLHRYCIPHYNARKKVRYEANREKYIAKNRAWQLLHSDSVKAANKRHKSKPEVKARQHSLEQQLHVKAVRRNYDLTHRKESQYYNNRWKRNNKDKVSSYAHNRRAKQAGNGGEHTGEEWRALMARYGWHCIKCGALKPLCFDHIIAIINGGSNDISNGQPYCVSCNTSKGSQFEDLRDHPGHGRLYDTRIDLPIGAVDITMADLPVPDHARHPGRVDIVGRTEKMCTYHKQIEPIGNFRLKSVRSGLPYPECREAEAIHNRERRAKKNPDYKPSITPVPKVRKPKLDPGLKSCSGPSHKQPTVLSIDKFPTRRAASGNLVPKSYCRECLIKIQRQTRANKKNGGES